MSPVFLGVLRVAAEAMLAGRPAIVFGLATNRVSLDQPFIANGGQAKDTKLSRIMPVSLKINRTEQ